MTTSGAAAGGPGSPAGDFLPSLGGDVRRETRRSVRIEIWVVLLITFGTDGLTSLVDQITTQIQANQRHVSLNQITTQVAAPKSTVPLSDLFLQLISIAEHAAWGALGLYLLWRAGCDLSARLGLNLARPGRDTAVGVGLAALIGIPGLALYIVAHQLGFALTVQASTMTDTWWRIPVTVLLAFQNGFGEEVVVIGYLLIRLRQLDVPTWLAVAAAALLRGSYHLYQGYGAFVGNAIMGVIFAIVFLRWRRLGPLILAHGLIDTVTLVGYPLVHGHIGLLPWL